ncbi:MAG: DUF2256 domain-containing protein [Pseudomonadota bacterium]
MVHKKINLPKKNCVHCDRPMVWRKSWAKNWDDVKYCSDRCRFEAKRAKHATGRNSKV